MSNSRRVLEDLLALEQPCSRCGAERGAWCVVPAGYKTAGRPADYLHTARSWATRHAQHVGYTRGLEQAYAIALRILQGEHEIEKIEAAVDAQLEQATRWAREAHQAALIDVPADWRR